MLYKFAGNSLMRKLQNQLIFMLALLLIVGLAIIFAKTVATA